MAAEPSAAHKDVHPTDLATDQLLPVHSTTSVPSWALVFALICLPVLAPFALVCWSCLIARERIAGPKNCCLRMILAKKCIASCLCGCAACFATPFVYALGVLCGPVTVLAEWGKIVQTNESEMGSCARMRCLWLLCSLLVGLCLAPVVLFVLMCGLILAPPCGLILCALKVVGCYKPQVQPNNAATP